MTPLSDLWTHARSFWQEASTPTRASIAGAAAFLLVLAVALSFWAASPEYVRVFTGTPAEAQSLAKELDKAAIPYRVSDDGGALSVARGDAGRARQVAGGLTGISDARLGLRGLDTMGPFTTYEQQQARIERAQEEAIESELGQYTGVQRVSVNLALPAENSRVGEDVPPKAAVTLTPMPGVSFDEGQVAAMAYVVANSIPHLTPENVTIASSEGITLWAGADSASGTGGTGALKARTQAEKAFVRTRQADLQASLDRVFGPGKAIVYVDATLDLDKQETEAQRVVPASEDGKGLLESEQTTSKQYSGPNAAGAAGGAVGADANQPGAPSYPVAGANTRGGPESYKTTEELSNYQNSTENVHTIKAVGEPKRMNVSVWVDDKLPAPVQTAIQTWVQGSVLNPTNAATTKVTVVPAPFDRTAQKAATALQAANARQAMLQTYAPYIVLPLCLVGMILAAWLLTRRRPDALAAGEPALALAGGGPGGAAAISLGAPAEAALGSGGGANDVEGASALPGNADMPALEADGPQLPPIRPITGKVEPELEAILNFIDERPETAALLLRSWTTEETRSRG